MCLSVCDLISVELVIYEKRSSLLYRHGQLGDIWCDSIRLFGIVASRRVWVEDPKNRRSMGIAASNVCRRRATCAELSWDMAFRSGTTLRWILQLECRLLYSSRYHDKLGSGFLGRFLSDFCRITNSKWDGHSDLNMVRTVNDINFV